ncbi:MAG: Ig-like domain-containing protein [Anaerolineae bacterium]|nr:Ig-like domain-containing protein [Anaerolineae bacterium]
MRRRRGCQPAVVASLVVLLACLVFGGLAAGLVLIGDVPIHAPRVVHVEPLPGEPVLPTTSFTLTFDQPMDRESVGAAFSVLPAVPGSLEWNAARDQVTFVPAGPGFEPGTTYTLRLYGDARSAMFHRALAHDLSRSFLLPPLLIESSPAPGTDGLGAHPELRAEFSYDLDCENTPQTFTIVPGAQGAFDCQGHTLIFRPTAPLAPDTTYQASLAHTFLINDPAPRPGVNWSFRTALPLSVTDLLPAPGRLLVDLHEPVRITFNRPIDPDFAAPNLTVTLAEGEPVAGQVTWEAAGSALVFDPHVPWLPGTEYLVSLQSGIADRLGFALQEPVTAQFATLPMIKMPDPVPGAEDVPLDSAILIPFTRPMDRASVEAGLVFMPGLDASYAWDGDTLIITPRGGLAASTHYTLSVAAGVCDATGAPLGSVHSWDLHTEPFLLDARMPSDAPLLSLRTPLTLTFALPMDPASVRSALTISPRTPVKLSWSGDGRTLVLQPEIGWQPGAAYQILLRAKAATAGGQQELGEDQIWPFLTAPSEVHFGLGPNVQVLPGPGTRTLQALHRGADAVDWHLYAITPTQFTTLYTPGPDALFAQEPAQVDTAGLEAAGSWRQDVPVSAFDWQPITVTLPSWVQPGLYAVTGGAQPDSTAPGSTPGLLLAVTDHVLVVKRAPRPQPPATATPSATATAPVTTTPAATPTVPVTPTVTATSPITATPTPTTTAPLTTTPALTTTASVTTTPPPTPTASVITTPAAVIAASRPTELLIWDMALATGAPVVSATVVVYSTGGRPLAQGITDEQGLLTLTLPAGEEPLFVISDRAGDLSLTGLDPTWSDGTGWYADAPPAAHTLVTIPDRCVYHPGDIVRFTSIVRLGDVHAYTLPPEGTQVTVSIKDGQGQVVASRTLATTVFGTVHGEMPLPDDVAPGPWQLVTQAAGDESRIPIHVQPPAAAGYQVAVHPARSVYVAGEPITVTVSASDDTGDPLTGAPVELSVHRAYLSADVSAGAIHFEPALLSIHGATGSDGRWTGALPPDLLASEPADVLLALAATLNPMDNVQAGSYQLVSLRPAPYDIKFLLDTIGYTPGEQITISARILDREGLPAVQVPVTATLLDTADQAVGTGSARSGEDGLVHFSVAPEEQGWYQVCLAATDEAGRRVQARQWLWVVDPATGVPWDGENGPAPGVTADHPHYAAGDKAHLALRSPAPGPALLAVERSSVRAAFPIEIDAGTTVITLPIQAEDEPNVYLSLSRWSPITTTEAPPAGTHQEHTLQAATAELQVPAVGKQLSLTITPGAASYAPGEEATVQVRVASANGDPVRAQVSLSVVEANVPPPALPTSGLFTAFYGPRPQNVATANSLAPGRQIVTVPPSPPDCCADTSAVTLTATFRDTIFWAPALLADAAGLVTVTFPLPNAPGEWQIVAQAITTDTHVGEATTRFVTTGTIAVQPFLPTFLVQGDIVTITALVRSYLTQPVSATVRLDAPGLSIAGSPAARQQIIHLPPHGSGRVSWQAAAIKPGRAEIIFDAIATYRAARLAGRGAARATLPILPLTLPSETLSTGQVDPVAPEVVLTFTLPADTLDLAHLDLFLAASPGPATYRAYVNDILWQEDNLSAAARAHLVLTYTETLSPALLIAGDNVLRLVVVDGSLYYTASVTTYLTATAISEPFAAATTPALRRSYHLPGEEEPVERVALGELVEVHLWLDVPSETPYAVIHDRLPAGLSFVRDDPAEWLPTGSASLPVTAPFEAEGGLVTFYLSDLERGTYTLSYLARATIEGHFIAPPARLTLVSGSRASSHSGTTRLAVMRARPE